MDGGAGPKVPESNRIKPNLPESLDNIESYDIILPAVSNKANLALPKRQIDNNQKVLPPIHSSTRFIWCKLSTREGCRKRIEEKPLTGGAGVGRIEKL